MQLISISVFLLAAVPIALGQMPMKIEKTYDIAFPVQAVYSAWVSSSTVIQPATQMDIDPVVGGHYRLIVDTPEMQMTNEGKFQRVVPNARVTYTWEWNGDGEVSTIDVTFEASAVGTRIKLTHDGFTKAESVTNHDAGWDSYIEGFVAHLATN